MVSRERKPDKILVSLIVAVMLILPGCSPQPTIADFDLNEIPDLIGEPPTNVVLIIGDGMAYEQIRAGRMWVNGDSAPLTFEDSVLFPVSATMGTANIYGGITDSAASATAMATGRKVENHVLSMDLPGNGSNLQTIAEMARERGKAVGLVTTDSVYSATPAAFVLHHDDRNDYSVIIDKMLSFRPDVLFGGGKDLSGGTSPGVTAAETSAYTHIVQDETGLVNHNVNLYPVFGRFGDDIMPYVTEDRGNLPYLDHMTEKALDILDGDPDGFFLLIENELTDEACHLNDISRLTAEVDALNGAVDAVLDWAGLRTDTLIVVTADHETGGLDVLENAGAGNDPTVSWSTSGHTLRDVGLFARGPDSETFSLVRENVDIYRIMSRYYQ